ncbi:MAG TPA: hypothetical protein VK968_16465 [Roseimicrobium sp.]|nr:hypothetical protein [Roseimicrobium sp.]
MIAPFLLIALTCSGSLRAQASLPVESKQPPPVMVRFAYIRGNETTEPDMIAKLASGKVVHDLTITPGGLSDTLEYRGPAVITLFRSVVVEGKTESRPLAKLEFPASWRGVLFLVTHDKSQRSFPYRFTPIEYWGEDMSENSVRLYNFCPAALGVKLADVQEVVEINQRADFVIGAGREFLPIKIACRPPGGDWELKMRTGLPKPARARMLLFVFPDSKEFRNLRTVIVNDVPMPPKQPDASQ